MSNWPRCKDHRRREATSSTCSPTLPTLCHRSTVRSEPRAKVAINAHFSDKQQAFLNFVLAHYVSVGVEELDQEKLTPLLRLSGTNT